MNLMGLFRSPQNELEKGGIKPGSEETGINNTCPHCGALLPISEQWENLNVCTSCGYHFRIGPRERVAYLADEGTFEELDAELISRDLLDFPGYDQKLRNAKLASREKEGVVCGTAEICSEKCALFLRSQFHDGQYGHRSGGKNYPSV